MQFVLNLCGNFGCVRVGRVGCGEGRGGGAQTNKQSCTLHDCDGMTKLGQRFKARHSSRERKRPNRRARVARPFPCSGKSVRIPAR
jgi:hypothetical protein